MRNEVVDAVVNELSTCGITPDVEHGGKHMKIKWCVDDRERVYITPKTTSDFRAPLNARAEIRRMMREDGVYVLQAALPNKDDEILKRVKKLQDTVEALTDLFLESRSTPPALVLPSALPELPERKLPGREQRLLNLLTTDWVPASRLYRATSENHPKEIMRLLQRRGLVERRGGRRYSEWRKV